MYISYIIYKLYKIYFLYIVLVLLWRVCCFQVRNGVAKSCPKTGSSCCSDSGDPREILEKNENTHVKQVVNKTCCNLFAVCRL